MKNLEIARILFEIADILEMQGIEFKPRAYRKAALNIQSLSQSIEEVAAQGKLDDIPGVGESIEEKVEEIIKTGKCQYYEKLRKKMPVDIESLNAVPGLGPKRIQMLYRKLKIKSITDLEKAARQKKIRKLPLFNEKYEQIILEGIPLAKKRGKRMLLGFALPIAQGIKEDLKKLKEVKQIEIGGSLRRKQETIGDLDFLATSSQPKKVMEFFCHLPDVKKVVAKGATKSVIRLKSDLEVDLRVVKDESFGSALQYFTGNKAHNIKLRQIAIKKGLKLNEYGLFKKKTNKQVAGKTEKEVYNYMGLELMPPELRQDTGEVEAAQAKKLPSLIGYGDLKGDLHSHTTWSEGANTLEEMATQAKKEGLKYLGITDHTQSLAIARGMKEKEILKQKKAVAKVNKKMSGITLLHGVEANILKDGSIDVSNKVLKELDFTLAAIHSQARMTEKQMTARLCKAMENEYLTGIAHPTGRKINEREAYPLNMGKFFEKAKETNTFLEINSYPIRLDLKDTHIKRAIKDFKLKLYIGSDAHVKENIHWIELGTATARRGWAAKKDIVNTLDIKGLKKIKFLR
jgi:DNA polymerase (family 10)